MSILRSARFALVLVAVAVAFGVAHADKFRTYSASTTFPKASSKWAMVYGKSPYYTDINSTFYNHDDNTSLFAWTYWSIQSGARWYKWDDVNKVFGSYPAQPDEDELNEAYKEKTQAMITDAPAIFFLCPDVQAEEFQDVMTMIDVNHKVCGDPAITVTSRPDVAKNQLSFTGYELLCIKTVPGALAKTTFFDLGTHRSNGEYRDAKNPSNWYWVDRCHGASAFMQ